MLNKRTFLIIFLILVSTSYATALTVSAQIALPSSANIVGYIGGNVTIGSNDVQIINFTKVQGDASSYAVILYPNGTVIANEAFVGLTATFASPVTLKNSTKYVFMTNDSANRAFNYSNPTSPALPLAYPELTFVYGMYGTSYPFTPIASQWMGIKSVGVVNLSISFSNITFLSQSPSNITSTSLFSQNVNITYQYNTSILNPKLNYSIVGGLSCVQYLNGSCILQNDTWQSMTPASNTTSGTLMDQSFTLQENQVYAYNSNLNLTSYNQAHNSYTPINANQYIQFGFLNISSTSTYQVLEVMANVSSGGLARVYACNSSYSTGSVSTSNYCSEIGLINSTTFNHTHSTFQAHQVIPYTIISGKINGVGIQSTQNMSFIITSVSGTLYVWNVPVQSRDNAVQTTLNNGVTWNNQAYTVDSHIHFWTNNEYLKYFAYGSSGENTTIQSELIDVATFTPSPPNIFSPFGTIQDTSVMLILYTNGTATFPGGYMSYYNITLLNPDLTINSTIKSNNGLNNTYWWDVFSANLSIGQYYVQVCGFDNLNQTSCDQEYFNLTRNAQINVTAYNASTQINTFSVNFTNKDTSTTTTLNTTTGVVSFNATRGQNYTVTLDAVGFAYNSQNYTVNVSYKTINFTLFDNNRIDFTILDEINSSVITQIVSLTLQSNDTLQNYTITTGYYNISGIMPGTYELTFTSQNYSTRTYEITIGNRTYQTLTARLSSNNQSIAVGVYTKTQTFQVLPGVLITIQRQYAGGSFATILQGNTDVNGFITFNVQQGTNYRVILSSGNYSTKQFNQQFYLANSPYTFILTDLTSSPYINVFNGVNYYYSPTNTSLQNGSYTFQITTYNASFIIAWTAVNANGSIVNVSGSSGGGTASIIVDLSNYDGTFPVTYMFNYYNVNTGRYSTYYIPINYYITTLQPFNNTIPQTFENFKTGVGNAGWLAIIGVFIVLAGVVTVVQLSGNVLAGVATGFAILILLAAWGWISPILVAFIVITSGFLLFAERQ